MTHCRVVDFEGEKMLRIRWEAGPLDTTVTWALHARAGGRELVTVHEGFDPNDATNRLALDGMRCGWSSIVLRDLREVLATPDPAPPEGRARRR